MKLKQRAWISLLGCVVVLGLLSLNPGNMTSWIQPSQPIRIDIDSLRSRPESGSRSLDLSSVSRDLANTNELLSRNLSYLLAVITNTSHIPRRLDDPGVRARSGQILNAIVRDRELSDALLGLAGILEAQRTKRVALTKEVIPGISLGNPESPIAQRDTVPSSGLDKSKSYHVLSEDNIQTLRSALKLSGYVTHRNYTIGTKERPRTTLKAYNQIRVTKNSPSFRRFHSEINNYELYPTDGTAVDELISDITSLPLVNMAPKSGGTQLKLTFFFSDRGQAIFKPMRFPREQETLPDHFYFSDYERHNAEIAAFRLDRILGFHRVPPVVGRVVNVTQDIWRYADGNFEKTFFISPAGNVCFHGQCDYYCDTGHAICGRPELLEGSFVIHLPTTDVAPRSRWRHPWRRSYHKRRKARWETDYTYCDDVRTTPPYDRGRRLLDLIDMAILDFLTGNMDRHHYETFSEFGNDSYPIHFDNGRGFGRASHDELSILAPVYQCCLIRASTLARLLSLYTGPVSLSRKMRESLSRDVLSPILTDAHIEALDRRLETVLVVVKECLTTVSYEDSMVDSTPHSLKSGVVVDDGL